MKRRGQPESGALKASYLRYVAGDDAREERYEQTRADTEVASMIHRVRTEAGLSQRELAKRVGTTASVICRLEDADYSGHSLAMLRRIAAAVGKRVEVRFVAMGKRGRRGGRAVA